MIIKNKILIIALLLCIFSCSTDVFHSGEAILDGTTVRYLVSESDLTMKVSAKGSTPDATIYVKLMNIQSSAITETVVDSINNIPHENTVSLSKDNTYTLFLEKGSKSIGIGQFTI